VPGPLSLPAGRRCRGAGRLADHQFHRQHLALADEAARDDLAARYPGLWQRVTARRSFMAEVLGIRLRPEVLPLSDLAGYLPPYWLSPHLAMRRA
jgi:hypothetical protein